MEILLIHGLFGSLNDPSILRAFDPHRVHAPDLLGYGSCRNHPTQALTLEKQVEHVARYLQSNTHDAVHVVGHSVGGAVGLLLASHHPELVRSYTSVEGNMTLKDAFWSAEIAQQPLAKLEVIINDYTADVAAWIAAAGVIPDARTIRVGETWLANQPASTIRAQASAVVEATGSADYLQHFDTLARHGIPIHLVAGEKSFTAWDLPAYVCRISDSLRILENRGHLMMLEDPLQFAHNIMAPLGQRRATS